MKHALLVLVTCADKNQAEQLGELILKDKLAACVQVIHHADSMFLWPPGKKQIDYADEAILLIKTLDHKWNALEKKILNAHTYENPEIIGIALPHVTRKYQTWLENELG